MEKRTSFRQTSVRSVCQNAGTETIHFPISAHSWLHPYSISQPYWSVLASIDCSHIAWPQYTCTKNINPAWVTFHILLVRPSSYTLPKETVLTLIWSRTYVPYSKIIPMTDYRCAFLLLSVHTYTQFTVSWAIMHCTKYVGKKWNSAPLKIWMPSCIVGITHEISNRNDRF